MLLEKDVVIVTGVGGGSATVAKVVLQFVVRNGSRRFSKAWLLVLLIEFSQSRSRLVHSIHQCVPALL